MTALDGDLLQSVRPPAQSTCLIREGGKAHNEIRALDARISYQSSPISHEQLLANPIP